MKGDSIIYVASLLRSSVVADFAAFAGYGSEPEDLAKARKALSRCLSRATAEFARRGLWRFSHRKAEYRVFVEGQDAVRIVQLLPGGAS